MKPHSTWRRRRRVATRVILASYVLLMLFGGCADKFILHPSTQRIDPRGAVARQVAAGDGVVEVWTRRAVRSTSERPGLYVLEFCGNGQRAEDIAWYIAWRYRAYDAEAWVMNYPGYGQSTGPARLKAIAPAALAVFDRMREEAGGSRIVVAGNSLGTTAALYVAAHRPVAGVVLQNPPPLRQLIVGRYGWWNLWLLAGPIAWQVPGELDSVANANRCQAPAVFVLAGQDELVTPKYHQRVVDAYAGPKRIVPLTGAGHNSGVEGEDEVQLGKELDWLMGQGATATTRRSASVR